MSTVKPSPSSIRPLSIRRIDPEKNMARFYGLSLQPTLFGDMSLVRAWGRIGTRGQAKVETFSDLAEAEEAFARIERVKRRRGYGDAGA